MRSLTIILTRGVVFCLAFCAATALFSGNSPLSKSRLEKGVSAPPCVTISATGSSIDPSCWNVNNGEITITVTGGLPSFSYTFALAGPSSQTFTEAPGVMSHSFTNLAAGAYVCNITYDAGCPGAQVVNLQLTAPSQVVATITNVVHNPCIGGAAGSITASGSGGSGPYYFSLNGMPFVAGNNIAGPNSNKWSSLGGGTYSIQVMDDFGCFSNLVPVTINTTQTTPVSVVPAGFTDVTCFGLANGTATFTASGGNGGSYSLSYTGGPVLQTVLLPPPNNTHSATFTGLAAGNYIITATDNFGCGFPTAMATITQPADLVLAKTQINVTCNGGANGSIDLSVSGGVPGYTYLWSNGATTQDISGLTAGTYSVVVKGAAPTNCTKNLSVTITQPTQISMAPTVITHASCFGGTNGAVNISPSGGVGPYTFAWSFAGATTEDISGLTAGTYTVTVTDASLCTRAQTSSVTQPTILVLTETHVNVACNSELTGSISPTATGGTAPYSWDWADLPGLINPQNRTGLAAGTYNLVVTDGNGCQKSLAIIITQPAAISGTFIETHLLCFGYSNGSVFVNAITGGVPPYLYEISGPVNAGPQMSGFFSGLTAGSYLLTVSDANGCTANGYPVLTQPTAISASETHTNATCNGGATGTATITGSGGAGVPYTISFPGKANQTGNPATTFTGIAAGNYIASVTDANGCPAGTVAVHIGQPEPIVVALAVTQHVSCFGGSNGSVTASVTGGGQAPFMYSLNGGAFQASPIFSGLLPGTYSVQAKDASIAACTGTSSQVIVVQPTLLVVSPAVTNVSCFGAGNGSILVNVVGGILPYQFSKDGGVTYQPSATFTGLVPNTYNLMVKDGNLCLKASSATVTQPTVLNISAAAGSNISCGGVNNGKITLTASGGTPPYTFQYRTTSPVGAWLSSAVNPIIGLTPGNYDVRLTNANGCLSNIVSSVNVPNAVAALSLASSTKTNVSCFGANNGSITLVPSGGTAPYVNFDWADLAPTNDIQNRTFLAASATPYSVTMTDNAGCTVAATFTITQPNLFIATITGQNSTCFGSNNGSISTTTTGGTGPNLSFNLYNAATNTLITGPQLSPNFTGLPPGSYKVVASDNNGCVSTSNTINLTQPALLTGSGSMSGPGQATIVGSGGTPNFTIALIAFNGIPLTPPYTTQTVPVSAIFGGLAVGQHTFSLVDANGCPAVATVTVNITIPANVLNATATVTANVTCNGGSNGAITVSASGGIPPYQYSMDGGAFQASPNFTGLSAGSHTATVKDASNATANAAPVTISQPTMIAATAIITGVSCNGGANGAIDLTPSGGTPGYTYLWSNAMNSQDISGLVAGTYTVLITDANSCVKTFQFIVMEPAALTTSFSNTNVVCNGASTGAINLTVGGGVGPFSFVWSPGGATTEDLAGLAAGTWSVVVTDANGCLKNGLTTITQNTAIVLSATTTPQTCAANGSVNLTVSGGVPGYTFLWSNGATTEDLASVPAGSYTVNATDFVGCVKSMTFVVANNSSVVVSGTPTAPLCFAGNNGQIVANAAGGVAPYTFTLTGQANQTGAGPVTFSNLMAGNYTLGATDANNCAAPAQTITVSQPANLVLTETHTNPTTIGGTNGSITVTATGGMGAVQFRMFSPGPGPWQPTGAFTGLGANTYIIEAKDANNCTKTITVILTNPSAVTAFMQANVQPTCNGGSNGSITIGGSGGTLPYTFSLNGSAYQAGATFTGLAAGVHLMAVKDAIGSIGTANFTLGQPTLLAFTTTTTPVNCSGNADGAILFAATGGTGAYMYKVGNLPYQTNPLVMNLIAGTYVVMVKDANGCEKMGTAVVLSPMPLTLTPTVINVTCNGGSNGSISLAAAGGTLPYLFKIGAGAYVPPSNPPMMHLFSNLTAGTYSISVKDAHDCITTISVTVTQPAAGAFTMSVNTILPVTCTVPAPGNGEISLNVSGCLPPNYTWTMAGGGTFTTVIPSITGLAAGTYSVSATSGGTPFSITNMVVNASSQVVENFMVLDNASCKIKLGWNAKANVTGYELRHKLCSSGAWITTILGLVTSHTITTTATNCYNIEIRYLTANCMGMWVSLGSVISATYDPPMNTSATVLSNSSAKLDWQSAGCGMNPSNVEVRFRKVGVLTWTVVSLPGSSLTTTLTGLMPGATYEYRIRNKYVVSGVVKYSNYSPMKTFSLPVLLVGNGPNGLFSNAEFGIQNAEFDILNAAFEMFPNPASDRVQLHFTGLDESNPLTIRLLSTDGRLVKQATFSRPAREEWQEWDIDELNSGIYLLDIRNGSFRSVEKLVKR